MVILVEMDIFIFTNKGRIKESEVFYQCIPEFATLELEVVMQLFCSEFIFNLNVLSQHVGTVYLFIRLCQEPDLLQ